MVLNVHQKKEEEEEKKRGLFGSGRRGQGGREGGKMEIICLSLQCHHQNDICIKVGSDESHFNVSLIVWDKVTRQCPQTTTFEEGGEPKRNQTAVLLEFCLSA